MDRRIWRRTAIVGVVLMALTTATSVLGADCPQAPKAMRFACAGLARGRMRYVSRSSACHSRHEALIDLARASRPVYACASISARPARLRHDGHRSFLIPKGATWRAAGPGHCRPGHQVQLTLGGKETVRFCAASGDGLLLYVSNKARCRPDEISVVAAGRGSQHCHGTARPPITTTTTTTTTKKGIGGGPAPGSTTTTTTSATGTISSTTTTSTTTREPEPPEKEEPPEPEPPANVAPTVQVPIGQRIQEGEALVFSTLNADQISVQDSDAGGGVERVTLSVQHGSLTPASPASPLSEETGSGTAEAILEGKIASLDEALEGLTYQPSGGYSGTDTLTVEINDLGHSGSGGAKTATGTVQITVTPITPVLSGIESTALSYTSGSPAMLLTGTLEVSDAKTSTLAGATVSVSAGFAVGQDVLGFANQNGITGSYDAATGVLALTGTASLANYQAALRSVSFSTEDASTEPLSRTVSFEVRDSAAKSSNAVSRTLSVAAAPPTLTGIESSALAYVAGEAGVPITSTLAVSDLKSTTLAGATVSISSGFAEGQDVLGFTDQNGITGSYDAKTGVMTLSGAASLANYQTALRSLTYEDTEPAAPSTGSRTISFQVSDGDPSDSASEAVSREVSVSASPPPVLSGIESSALSYTSGAAAVAVTSSLEVSDARSAQLTEATISISAGFAAGQDVLGFVNQNGITGSYDAATGVLSLTGTASLANYQTALRSVSFSTEDASTEPLSRTVSFTVSDGLTSHPESNPASRTISIAAAPPALSGIESSVLSYEAGAAPASVTSTLAVSDLKSTTLAGATVSISAGFVEGQDVLGFTDQNGITGSYDAKTGVMTLSGAASLANYQTALRSLTYEDAQTGNPTTGTRTISFQVDDGGTSDATSNLVSREVEVLKANLAPIAEPDSYTAQANTTLGVGTSPSAPALAVSGSVLENDSNPNSAKTALTATAGSIESTHGGSVTMNENGTFTYLPPVGFTGADSFKYTVNDNEPTPKTAEGTVEIQVQGPVIWYVDNSKTGGDGRSSAPLSSLSEAETDSKTGAIIFLYKGSGSYAGGSGAAGLSMKEGQRLIGQDVGLTVEGHVLVAASGGDPTITNTAEKGVGITLASKAAVDGVAVEATRGQGIYGSKVAGASIEHDAVTGADTEALSEDAAIMVEDPSGTVTVSSSTVSNSGRDGVRLIGGAEAASLDVNEDTISGSKFIGLDVESTGKGAITFEIAKDILTGSHNRALWLNATTASSATITGTIVGDKVGEGALAESGSTESDGISIEASGSSVVTASVKEDTVLDVHRGDGIEAVATEGSATLNLSVLDDTVTLSETTSQEGLYIASGAAPTDTTTVCLNATGNDLKVSGKESVAGGFNAVAVYLDQQEGGKFEVQGTGGGASAEQVAKVLEGQNTLVSYPGEPLVLPEGTYTAFGGSCPVP